MITPTQSTWKLYDQNPVTHSAAHYLLTIADLMQEQGYVRLVDVAKKLNITPGSCSIGLRTLKKKGYITHDNNKFVKLTSIGQEMVQVVKRNDDLLMYLFHTILGVNKKQAEVDACKMEHLLSHDTATQLAHFINIHKSKRQEFDILFERK